MVGNHPESAKAEGGLTATPTGGAGKEELRDPEEDGADGGEKAAEAESEEKSPAQDEPEKKSD